MMMFLQILLLFILCCSAQEPSPPSMLLNSAPLPSGSEVVLTAGTDSFILGCRGNGSAIPVGWNSTAFKLRYEGRLTDSLTVTVRQLDARHTGTYRCGYLNQSLGHLDSWLHIYVKDPTHSANLFVTPRRTPSMKEGQDLLFECLLTDPNGVTELGFRMEEDVARERGLPRGMNVTIDRYKGALIRDMKLSYRGNYVCTASKNGKEYTSNALKILQVTATLRSPPTVSVSDKELVRIVGERMDITCITSNPNHFYSVTWTHTHLKALKVIKHQSRQPVLQTIVHINKTVSVAAVEHGHGGMYTCTAINEAGTNTATTALTVLDGPYLRVYLQPVQNANISTHSMEENGAMQANVGSDLTEVYGGGASIVEVKEGQDVKLTLVIETYPPLLYQRWTTPSHLNVTAHQESYSSNNTRYEATLLLGRVRPEERGTYTLQYSTPSYNNSYNLHLRVYKAHSAKVNKWNGSLTCHSPGYPLTMLWYICPGVRETCGDNSTYQLPATNLTNETEDEVQTQLLLPATDDDITVECVAFSRVWPSPSRDVYVPTHHIRVLLVARPAVGKLSQTVIGVSSMAAVLFLLLVVAVYKYTQKPRYEVRWKIIESSQGNNYSFIDPTQLPYNQKWEFPRDRLRLGAVLGAGAFGKVVEATAYGLGKEDNTLRVAVKMLKPSAHSEEREALMSELKILSHLGYHDYIVNLLGACTLGGPMLMITEYCSHGDLLNFLRGRAQMFLDSISSVSVLEEERDLYKNMASQQARIRTDSGISCGSEVFQEMLPLQTQTQADNQSNRRSDSWSLDVDDLILFSYQVAQGMEFLASRNCIHRDVAARNVLLTDHRVAKICDFGLARDIMNDDNYIVKGNARLPVKWMAPESIFECVYTVQSDVWSYGILLWEIFSLGKSPYPNIAVDANFYKMIKDGRHMSRPDFAPPELYQIMTHCWSLEPTERPTFSAIGQLIKRLLLMTNDVLSNHSDQPNYWNMHEGVATRREGWELEEEECREAGGEVLKKEDEAKEVGQQEAREEEPLMMTTKNVTNVYQHC